MDQNLLNNNVIQVALSRNAGTTGTTIASDVVDALGFKRITAILAISSTQPSSALLSFNHLHAETTTASYVATTASLSGVYGPARAMVIEIVDPKHRYNKFTANPTGNGSSPVGAIIVIKGGMRLPVTQSSAEGSVAASGTWVTPTS